MSARTLRAPRGLTLLELVIALGISALTVATAVTLLVQEQRVFTTTAGERSQQEAGRAALRELTSRLRTAGYGVDPNLAMDFGLVDLAPRPNLPGNVLTVQQATYACATAVRCRDSATGGSDEIVFYARDPMFNRVASAVTSTSVTIVGDVKQPLYAGQVLQISCLSDPQQRAYVTVAADVTPPATPNAANPVVVSLLAGQSATGGRPVFPRENQLLADSCFNPAAVGDQKPVVTLVDRFRFYVAWYQENGTLVAAQTAGARPYLMLDQGLGTTASPRAPAVVATDVEDLQLAYLFNPQTFGGPDRLVGATVGTNIADGSFAMTTAGIAPAYEDAPDAAVRTTGNPTNIEAVRISVVVRSPDFDLALTTDADRTVPQAGNRAAFLGQPGYRRALFETTVIVRNLTSSAYPFPVANTAGGTGVNVGGG